MARRTAIRRRRRGWRRRRVGARRVRAIARGVVQNQLTADNVLIDSAVRVVSIAQGRQSIVSAIGANSSTGGLGGIDIVRSPNVVNSIATMISTGLAAGASKTLKFWIKSYFLQTIIKNCRNADAYLTRWRAVARRDIPLSDHSNLVSLLGDGFADPVQLGGIYSTTIARDVLGVTPFMNPALTSACRIKMIKTYKLLGFQEMRIGRKLLRNKRINMQQYGQSGTVFLLMRKGDSFDFFTIRGGVTAQAADGGGVPQNPSLDACQIAFMLNLRVHYSWMPKESSLAGATGTGINTGAALQLVGAEVDADSTAPLVM